MDKATLIIPKCLYIAVWMQLVDNGGQQEAAMVVIVNKDATCYNWTWLVGVQQCNVSIRGKISKTLFLSAMCCGPGL